MIKKFFQSKAGFTLIELVITIAIFAAMTTYLLAKYGKFNQSLLLTNLAYDIALTIRTAQSYGLNVKSTASGDFNTPYGVHFDIGMVNHNTCFAFFADADGDSMYDQQEYCGESDQGGEKISLYSLKRGSIISNLKVCADETNPGWCDEDVDFIDITFKRPDPDAIIYSEGSGLTNNNKRIIFAEITLQATDGTVKKIIVRSTGQIAIIN